jgi:titin
MDHYADIGAVEGFLDADVVVGRSYSYALLAYNTMGDGALSGNVTAVPFDRPGVPSGLLVSSSSSLVTLRWGPPSTDPGIPLLGYRVLRGPSDDALQWLATVDASVEGYDDTSVTDGVTYSYAVSAFNGAGDGPPCEVQRATPVGPPSAVMGLVGHAGDKMATISWDPPVTDGGLPIQGYRVLRGPRPAELRLIKELEATSFSDTGLANGVGIYYQVIAFNSAGLGPPSDVVFLVPAHLPDPPLDVFAEATVERVNLSWLPPPFDGGSSIIEYRIYRSTRSEDLALLATTTEVPLGYVDGRVDGGVTYNYAITAVTAAGEGPLSRMVSATPIGTASAPFGLVAVAGPGEVALTWRSPASDGGSPISGYVVLRGTAPEALGELAQPIDALAYSDTSGVIGVTYLYVIVAVNAAGRGDPSEVVQATPLPVEVVPGKIGALACEIRGAEVKLRWTPPEGDGGSPVTGYVVLRGASKDALEVAATLGAVTAWTDITVERGKTYYYTVAAINGVGQGEAFAASEVKVPKEKAKSPGFEAVGVGLALAIVSLLIVSRWKRYPR